MTHLHLPLIELSIVIPLIGAAWLSRVRDSMRAQRLCALFTGLTFFVALLAWQDFRSLHAIEVDDAWDPIPQLLGRRLFVIDELSAPLLPMVAMLYFLTSLATLRTKMRRFSFALSLVSEALRLATFSCRDPWMVIGLLAAGTVPPYLELRQRGKPTRVYVVHMALSVVLSVAAWSIVDFEGKQPVHSLWAIVPLLVAICIRAGMAPLHCWMTDFFEHATFATALLYVTPITGAYAVVRLVLPIAPDWVLHSIGLISLATVVYAAGMALVQREARRFVCYLFLSHSALVFVGLESVNTIGLTGALSVWISTALSLGGFGLALRSLESRFGRLSLTRFHGLYGQTPELAMCFLLTGLSSAGFPGTLGFVGTELLVDGAVEAYPHVGVILVLATAINGIAVVRAYFLLFTGAQHTSAVSLHVGLRERLAVLTLTTLIIGGGIFPQPGISSRYLAAEQILDSRPKQLIEPTVADSHGDN